MTWAVFGDSVAGTSHRAGHVPCQDAFRFRTFGPNAEWLAMAVADGAGSATHSEAGATLACDEFVRRIEALEPEVLWDRDGTIDLFSEVRNSLLARAQSLDVPPRELACTALLAVVGPASAAFAQLGDGAIVVGDGEGYRAVFWPEPAEYANATDFLTDDRYADAVHFETTAGPIVEVSAFTDGLQRLALNFSARSPHPAFFRPFFDRLRAEPDTERLFGPLRSFLDSPRVNDRTDDDKTLLLAVKRP